MTEVAEERIIMIEYPFPVEDGRAVAIVKLPKFLSKTDADRFATWVQTLVMSTD